MRDVGLIERLEEGRCDALDGGRAERLDGGRREDVLDCGLWDALDGGRAGRFEPEPDDCIQNIVKHDRYLGSLAIENVLSCDCLWT